MHGTIQKAGAPLAAAPSPIPSPENLPATESRPPVPAFNELEYSNQMDDLVTDMHALATVVIRAAGKDEEDDIERVVMLLRDKVDELHEVHEDWYQNSYKARRKAEEDAGASRNELFGRAGGMKEPPLALEGRARFAAWLRRDDLRERREQLEEMRARLSKRSGARAALTVKIDLISGYVDALHAIWTAPMDRAQAPLFAMLSRSIDNDERIAPEPGKQPAGGSVQVSIALDRPVRQRRAAPKGGAKGRRARTPRR
jgi:hypothetical protein